MPTEQLLARRCAEMVRCVPDAGAGELLRRLFGAEYLRPLEERMSPRGDRGLGATIALDARSSAGVFGISVETAVRWETDFVHVDGVVRGVPIWDRCDGIWVHLDGSDRVVLIEFGSPGVELRPRGTDSLPHFTRTDVRLTGCRVPMTAVVEIDPGSDEVRRIVVTTRVLVAAVAIGTLESALAGALDHVATRSMGGGRLIDHQAVRHRLGDVGAMLRAAQAALAAAASTSDVGEMHAKVDDLAGYLRANLAAAVAACSQVYGGRGFLLDHAVTHDYRDAPAIVAALGAGRPEEGLLAADVLWGSGFPTNDSRSRDRVGRFVDTELAPFLDEWNEAGTIPRSTFRSLARAGLTGIMIPADMGGAGGDLRASGVLVAEMMRHPMTGVMTSVLAQSHTVLPLLARLGTQEHCDRYLRGALSGELISGIAITDPAGGSDLVRSIGLRAVRQADGWRLDGEKLFITNGPIADFLIVLARTDPGRGALGMTLFLVDADTPGFTVVETLDKLGLRSSPTGRLRFDGCVVSDDAVLGAVGDGFRQATDMLSTERLLISVCALAMSAECLRIAIDDDHSSEPVLAAAAAELGVLGAFVEELVRDRDGGGRNDHDVAAAKFLTAEFAQRVTTVCQTLVARSQIDPSDYVSQSYRDARVLGIFAGSSETMREVFAGHLTIGRGMARVVDGRTGLAGVSAAAQANN